MSDTLLQIFLYAQLFVMGVIATIAAQHAYEHLRPRKKQPLQIIHPPPPPKPVQLSQETKNELQRAAEVRFESILVNSSNQFQKDLGVTSEHINNLVMRLATEIISSELERYQQGLEELQKQAAANLTGISAEVEKHKAEIEQRAKHELEVEKQRLLRQIDTKLGDAMASFLLEAMQHNVDLGSQNAYLVQLLEEHKDDFKKEVS